MSSRFKNPPAIDFAEFRELEERQERAGNLIWGLMASSHIAARVIEVSGASERTLGEIYPDLPHMTRFNVNPTTAVGVLRDAEEALPAMAISYVIALHEDFVKSCLRWLVPHGMLTEKEVDASNTAMMHGVLARSTLSNVDADDLALFQIARCIRNCYIHAGGAVTDELVHLWSGLSPKQAAQWEKWTGESYAPVRPGQPVPTGTGVLVATLAVCHRLEYDVNVCLQAGIPRSEWAEKAVRDYFSLPRCRPGNDPLAFGATREFADLRFGSLGLTDAELRRAFNTVSKKK